MSVIKGLTLNANSHGVEDHFELRVGAEQTVLQRWSVVDAVVSDAVYTKFGLACKSPLWP